MRKKKQIFFEVEKQTNADFNENMLISKKTLHDLRHLEPKGLIIYIKLLDMQQHNGYYVGNQKDLSKKLNISTTTLNKYLQILTKKGYIETIRKGQIKGTIYIIKLEKSA